MVNNLGKIGMEKIFYFLICLPVDGNVWSSISYRFTILFHFMTMIFKPGALFIKIYKLCKASKKAINTLHGTARKLVAI